MDLRLVYRHAAAGVWSVTVRRALCRTVSVAVVMTMIVSVRVVAIVVAVFMFMPIIMPTDM